MPLGTEMARGDGAILAIFCQGDVLFGKVEIFYKIKRSKLEKTVDKKR